MRAMILKAISDLETNKEPLEISYLPRPVPNDYEVLIKVIVCGVCHTELDEIEGRTPPSKLPVVPGHQVVGTVESTGRLVTKLKPGERVGVGWIFSSCGNCYFCLSGRENLCNGFVATEQESANGGYAEYMKINESYAYPIPEIFTSSQAAPLLCAGAVGYRSVHLSELNDGYNLGLSDLVLQLILFFKWFKSSSPALKKFSFAKGEKGRRFAKSPGLSLFWSLHIIFKCTKGPLSRSTPSRENFF